MVNMVKIISLLFLLSPFALYGQLSDWSVGGYLKNMSSYFDATYPGMPQSIGNYQNNLQGRLNIDWYAKTHSTISMQSRHLAIWQKNYKVYNNYLNLFTQNNYYFDLRIEYLEHEDLYFYSEIDRFYYDWNFDDIQITLGRQRMVWGTCLVWNPTDLFNPFNFLDFDYLERPGNDALLIQYYTGPVSSLNFAAKPGKTSAEVVYAFRYLTNSWNYDFAFIAGWQRNSLKLGMNWVGDLFDGGFRGEVLYSNPDRYSYMRIIVNPASGIILEPIELNTPYLSAALSYDYMFTNSLYLHLEYLYNGLGTTEKAALRVLDIGHTGEFSPARHSIFYEAAFDLTPLLRANIFTIYNPSDHSYIIGPSLQYSLATNWELYLLSFLSDGENLSEFGGNPNQCFIRAMFSF